MKLFGWKSGRDASRPALARGVSVAAFGEWPRSYEAQVREGYAGNPVAQRAVKLVADGVGWAPVSASDPVLAALVGARSGGQALLETLAAHLLLHGKRSRGSMPSCRRAWRRWETTRRRPIRRSARAGSSAPRRPAVGSDIPAS